VPAVRAGWSPGSNDTVRVSADLRLRYESDWDSRAADGTEREDRDRLRIRARVSTTWDPVESLRLGARVRTGDRDSQQSPHITVEDFTDQDKGVRQVLFDQYYVRAESAETWAWGGRNSAPHWKQNEFFWDDDVTLLGGAGGTGWDTDGGSLKVIGGYFGLPDGGVEFHGGAMAAGQLVWSGTFDGSALTAAGGVFAMEGDPGAEYLRNGNGDRDYTVWVFNLQGKRPVRDNPLTLGVDLMVNSESYDADDPDPFTAANHDETTGYVASAEYGQLKAPGDWLLGYAFASIEALAVNAAYAQDDWVRWGSASQTDSSDLKGHELRIAYVPAARMSLMARLFVAEAITSDQDGNRIRFDWNYTF
jgi:hypothetical protein